MHLTQALHRTVQQYPDRIATVYGDRVRTYRESAERIARLGGVLRSLGVDVGDRVAYLGLNSDRYHEYLLGTAWIGAAVNPVNIRWSVDEITYSLTDSDTRILLVDDAFADVAAELAQRSPVETIIFTGDGAAPDGVLDYEELLADAVAVPDSRIGGDSLFGLFYTGGTTGRSKGVMITHTNITTSGMGVLASGAVITPGGRLLHAAPMFHMADIAMWSAAALTGATHIVIPTFTPAAVADAVTRHRVTDALLVPTMIRMLVDHVAECGDAVDLDSIEHFAYGASPIAADLLERARITFTHARFTQLYGMTELSPVTTILPPEAHDDPSVSRSAGQAAPHAEVRIVGLDDREVARGTVGEIVARGDHVMAGYWNRPDATRDAVRDGWMHTGDLGYMDDRGFVFVVDRLKDMIVTGGENVYSVEVENALTSHPAVGSAAVIGVPDPVWGERVHAVVVPTAGAVTTEDELREHCRATIAGYKVPRTVAFANALPLSGAGKVLKRELRDEAIGAQEVIPTS